MKFVLLCSLKMTSEIIQIFTVYSALVVFPALIPLPSYAPHRDRMRWAPAPSSSPPGRLAALGALAPIEGGNVRNGKAKLCATPPSRRRRQSLRLLPGPHRLGGCCGSELLCLFQCNFFLLFCEMPTKRVFCYFHLNSESCERKTRKKIAPLLTHGETSADWCCGALECAALPGFP